MEKRPAPEANEPAREKFVPPEIKKNQQPLFVYAQKVANGSINYALYDFPDRLVLYDVQTPDKPAYAGYITHELFLNPTRDEVSIAGVQVGHIQLQPAWKGKHLSCVLFHALVRWIQMQKLDVEKVKIVILKPDQLIKDFWVKSGFDWDEAQDFTWNYYKQVYKMDDSGCVESSNGTINIMVKDAKEKAIMDPVFHSLYEGERKRLNGHVVCQLLVIASVRGSIKVVRERAEKGLERGSIKILL